MLMTGKFDGVLMNKQLLGRWRSNMRRRKPDMVMALVIVFALGVLATGYAQALSGS
ncbi:hypothetical protein SAMN04487951_12119 [Vreelandella arcis]|uniref:Uncharacterized protein n=1 Tax=Vreelandella arcis TaxID=416873 RepID=A0A1H0IP08_9GAMM|nr:hypothetical protein SAMN04487951_12119 [Halomonas arcis]